MRISVVCCTYDPALYDAFREAADSVLAQTHEDRELVIVIDGDRDLADRVESDYDDREDVLLHCNDRNIGLLASRNRGAELASGEVVAFIDDDAVADPEWLAELDATYSAHDALVAHKVFAYRTDPTWLAKRAFWQGYSKRAMAVLLPEPGGEESAFLSRLLTEFVPGRLRRLAANPSRRRAEQLFVLVLLTACVGFGYVYGALRYARFSGRTVSEG